MTNRWNKKATTLQVVVGDYLANDDGVVCKVVVTIESKGGTSFCRYVLESLPSGKRNTMLWGDIAFLRLKKVSEEDAWLMVLRDV